MLYGGNPAVPPVVRNVLYVALSTCLSVPGAWAACNDVASGNPALTASAASVCNATLTTYTGNNVAGAYDAGSVLNLLPATSITTTSNTGTYTLSSGGMNVGGVGLRPAAALVHGLGNLSVTSRGANSRAIYIYGGANASNERSKLQVDGNLTALRSVGTGGAVIQNVGGVIEVTGTARIAADATTTVPAPVDGVRNGASSGTEGSNLFHNGLTVYTSLTGILNSAGLVQVQGQAANINSTAGTAIDISAGSIDMPVQATVTSSTGTAIHSTGGQVVLGTTALTSTTPPSGTSLIKIGTQAVSVQGANGIQAVATGGNTVQMLGGIVNASAGDAVVVNSNATANEVSISAGQVTSTSGRAIFDGPGNGNTTVTLESAAVISGSIVLGDGSDSLFINGTDLSQVSSIDGGDDASTADGYVDRLTLAAMNGPQAANKFLNWERITLTGNSDLTWTGNTLSTGSGSLASEAMGLVVNGGSTSRIASTTFSISGDLTNDGLVALTNAQTGNTLTVTGNYGGGGTLALDVALGDSSSPADRMIVEGNTSAGPTILSISNLNGAGAETTGDGILVVQVNGTSAANSFALPAPGYIDVNGYRYQLVQAGASWYLQAKAIPASVPAVSISCTPATLSDSPNQIATCTLTASQPAPSTGLLVNLTLPAQSTRHTMNCPNPLPIAAGQTQSTAACTLTATPNTVAGDGNIALDIGVAAAADSSYSIGGTPAQVSIIDDDLSAAPAPVPTLQQWGVMALSLLLTMMGVVRLRRRQH